MAIISIQDRQISEVSTPSNNSQIKKIHQSSAGRLWASYWYHMSLQLPLKWALQTKKIQRWKKFKYITFWKKKLHLRFFLSYAVQELTSYKRLSVPTNSNLTNWQRQIAYHIITAKKEFMLSGYLRKNEALLHFLKLWGLLFHSSSPGDLLRPVILFCYKLQQSIDQGKTKGGLQGGTG